MNNFTQIKKALLTIACFFTLALSAQTNIAPMGLATHSGGGAIATGYGPDNYNDLINIGGLTTPWGWVSGGGWIQIEWTTPQTINEVILYPSDRPLSSAVLEYWNGSTWVFIMNVTAGTNAVAKSLAFNPVTTTRIRLNNVAGSNPNHTEIEVIQALLSANNAAAMSIDSPAGACEGTYNILATIANRGINQLDSVRVEWTLNGVQQPTYHHTTLLDTINGLFPTDAQVLLGSNTFIGGQTDDIKVWTSMPNGVVDTFNVDDTVSRSAKNLPIVSSFPYYEGFESGPADWVITGVSPSWAHGTPAKTNISGAASGSNAFVTGGLSTSTYNADENSQVNSPCFDMRNFEGTPWVALDVNWYSQTGFDGAALQYSIDGGVNWENVGQTGDPNNWFNDPSLDGRAGGSNEGWAGIGSTASGGWKRAKHVLPNSLIGSLAQFRLAFGSNATTSYDGFGFDNFTVVDFIEADLGPDKRSICQSSTGVLLDPGVNFYGWMDWSTGDTINETITVSAPGFYTVTYTDSMIDESTSDFIEIVQSAPPVINMRNYLDTISLDGHTSLDPQLPFNLDYNWTPGNQNIPFLVVRALDYGPGTHLFTLTVTDSVYCTDQANASVHILTEVGIGESGKGTVHMYPNPVREELFIEALDLDSEAQLQVINVNGKIVKERRLNAVPQQQISLDVSELTRGTYVVRIMSGEKVIVNKFVKE